MSKSPIHLTNSQYSSNQFITLICYIILENWSPREISKFQACYLMYGKSFGEFKVHVSIIMSVLRGSTDLKALIFGFEI